MPDSRNCDNVGRHYGNSKFVDFALNVDISDKTITVRVTNTTESPYLIRRNTQIAQFSVVTLEQSKFIKPVHVAILSMIPEGDTDLITYLEKLLRTKKLEQLNDTFWLPTLENPGKTEDHAQFKHESSQNHSSWRRKNNSIHHKT